MKIYIECKKSKDKDTLYHTLCVDMGYRQAILSMEKSDMCELADIRFSELYSMKEGDKIVIGDLIVKNLAKS
jgi:hypothetical protein